MIFALYPSIADQFKNYTDMIKGFPKAMTQAFDLDKLDFSNILSYFGTYSYLYLVLAGAIYSMIQGAGILSKEESERTVEFLLSKPVTRVKVVTGKLLSVASYLLMFNILFMGSGLILIELVKKNPYKFSTLMVFALGSQLVFYLFAAFGAFLSVFIVKAKSIYPLSIGIVFGVYIVGIASDMSDKIKGMIYVSPFKYVESSSLIETGRIELKYLVIMIVAIVIFTFSTYFFYNKKDIRA